MEIQIDRNEERLTVRKITVFTGNKEFEIEIDKFGELIITKEQYGEEESGMIIRPKVSNVVGAGGTVFIFSPGITYTHVTKINIYIWLNKFIINI